MEFNFSTLVPCGLSRLKMSLRMHGNLITRLKPPTLALFIYFKYCQRLAACWFPVTVLYILNSRTAKEILYHLMRVLTADGCLLPTIN